MMRVRAGVALAALAASVACSGTPTSPNIITPGSSVSGFIAQFATIGSPAATGVLHGGSVSVGPGGPTVTPTGPSIAVSGGAVVVSLTSSGPFQHAFVQVANTGQTTAPTGFYEIDLSAPVTSLQVLVSFATTFPSGVSAFALQFLVTDINGLGGTAGSISMTASASDIGSTPSVLASYSPNPAPFLGGTACTLSLQQGCLWEFNVVLQEVNGVAVPNVSMNEVFTFGTTTFPRTFTISIPEHGMATVTRNFACGTGGTSCATPAELAGGTYSYTLSGSDQNGNAFSFTGPTLTLTGQAGSSALTKRR